jgi:DNA polymerase I
MKVAKPRRRERQDLRERRPLLVIDGDSFAHRAYHALPKNILRDGGRLAGAILGFANRLLQLYRTERPRAVLVGWDTLEAATYRHDAFAAYQSGREFDDDLVEQLKLIPKFVAACGFANAKRAGYEADDFLAAAASAEERRGGTVLVASGDRDTFQLASARTTILYPVRAGEMARIGPMEVRERYGVEPKQVPDFIALRGDPSDKLPGASGVGAQSAAALLRRYGSLAALLKAGRFERIADDLRLYRAIATMNKKAPLPSLARQKPTFAKAVALARKWQLRQLAGRLEEMAKSYSAEIPAFAGMSGHLPCLLLLAQRRRESFKQFAIHRIVLRVILGVPLHAERKAGRLRDADRLNGAVIGDAFDHDAFARLEDALAVQRIDPNAFGTEQFGKDAAGRQPHVMAVGKHHLHIGMEFAVRQARRAVIDAAGQVADFRMQGAAEGDVHLLKAAADAEQRHAARDAGLDQSQRQRVAGMVVRLAARMRFMPEQARMHIGARAGEQDAVDRIKERADIGDLGRAGEDKGQGACRLGDRAQIALAHTLCGKLALHQMQAANHADDGFLPGHLTSQP